jgi:phosphoribosylformimino-5-aminoimidazole carboxamide ribotide isomerase
MGRGLNVEASRRFQEESGLEVIAAGGVSSLEDIQAARKAGLRGVIIGMALYAGEVNLVEALEIARGAG